MINANETVKVGKFQKPHALKGELNAILDIDPEYLMDNPIILDTDGILVPYFLESIRNKGTYSYLIKLKGINSEEYARSFVNKDILMLRTDIEDWLESNDFSVESLNGYEIYCFETNEKIGSIISIQILPDNPLFIVSTSKGEIFIPATEDFIKEIDDETGKIYMSLPDGLLDINNE